MGLFCGLFFFFVFFWGVCVCCCWGFVGWLCVCGFGVVVCLLFFCCCFLLLLFFPLKIHEIIKCSTYKSRRLINPCAVVMSANKTKQNNDVAVSRPVVCRVSVVSRSCRSTINKLNMFLFILNFLFTSTLGSSTMGVGGTSYVPMSTEGSCTPTMGPKSGSPAKGLGAGEAQCPHTSPIWIV